MLNPVFEDTQVFRCTDLYLSAVSAPAGYSIWSACHEIAKMLIEKNISYGNSALDPARIFSVADSTEQLKVRIDDKLNRVKNIYFSQLRSDFNKYKKYKLIFPFNLNFCTIEFLYINFLKYVRFYFRYNIFKIKFFYFGIIQK